MCKNLFVPYVLNEINSTFFSGFSLITYKWLLEDVSIINIIIRIFLAIIGPSQENPSWRRRTIPWNLHRYPLLQLYYRPWLYSKLRIRDILFHFWWQLIEHCHDTCRESKKRISYGAESKHVFLFGQNLTLLKCLKKVRFLWIWQSNWRIIHDLGLRGKFLQCLRKLILVRFFKTK